MTTTPTQKTMIHLSMVINPHEAGLHPYDIAFHRPESAPVRSLLDEGLVYAHPARTERATVWADSTEAIADVLTYHYGNEWSDLRLLPKQQGQGR